MFIILEPNVLLFPKEKKKKKKAIQIEEIMNENGRRHD
jgi:hypothetical protein